MNSRRKVLRLTAACQNTPFSLFPTPYLYAPGPQAEKILNHIHHFLLLLFEAILHVEEAAPPEHYGLRAGLDLVGPAP